MKKAEIIENVRGTIDSIFRMYIDNCITRERFLGVLMFARSSKLISSSEYHFVYHASVSARCSSGLV